MKVLVAALGHAWLRDQSFGMKVLEALRGGSLPADVELADWSFGTVTACQKLAGGSYDRAIFVSGLERDDRPPGSLARWRPTIAMPPEDEIHGRIADCVMGAVNVDTLLIMGRLFGGLPDDVVLVEAQPVDDTWGSDLSPALAGVLDTAVGMVLEEIRRPAGAPSSAPDTPAASGCPL